MRKREARLVAQDLIAEFEMPDGDSAVLLDESTIEKPWGWVFFYQSRRYVETGDVSSRLAGNAPIIVDARTGALTVTGTAHPVEYYIAEYERNHGLG